MQVPNQQCWCMRCKQRTEDVDLEEVPVGAGGRRRMRSKCGICGTGKSKFLPTNTPKRQPTGKLLSKRLQLNRFELPDLKLRNLGESVADIVSALNDGDVKRGGELCSQYLRRNNPNDKDRRVFTREGGSIASELYKSLYSVDPVASRPGGEFDMLDLVQKVMGKVMKLVFVRRGGALTLPSIRDIIKRVVAKAKPAVKAVHHAITRGTRDNWPPSSREVISKFGDISIVPGSFRVCRHPISTDGLVKKLAVAVGRSMPHDKLFHLLMVFKLEDGTELFLEKNEDLRVGKAQIKLETKKDMNCIPIQYNGSTPVTLNSIIQKTQARMGDRFFSYSSFKNNCQDFMINVMDANQMSGDRAFIKQDVENLLPVWMQKLADVGTDAKNIKNLVVEGYGNPVMRALQQRAQRNKNIED